MLDYFNALKVRTKLAWLTGILILGMLIYGYMSSITVQKIAINGPYYQEIRSGQALLADILPPPAYIVESYLLSFQEAYEKDPEELQSLIQKSLDLQKQYNERYNFWMTNLPESPIKHVLTESHLPAEDFFTQWHQQFLPAIKAGNHAKAEELLFGPLKTFYQLHRAKIDEVIRLTNQYNETIERTINDLGQKMQFFANISWIFTILMGVILATIIGYSVTNRLREVLKRILSTSNEIDGLLKTQTSLTSEQVSSVKDATSSLKGLNRSFKHTEELALDSSNRCKNSLHVSEKGNKLIKQMLEGLIQHKDKVLAIGQHVLRLTEITKQIHNIAAVTGNITNQTNILALNAAVQAAQVKQHSESFSVIASEIRKLADESKKFLLQIDVLAEDIKSATDSTMQIADEGNKTVQECIKLAQSSTEAFNAIISITTDSFVGAEQVSKNVKQQSSAVERVTEALDLANTSTGKTLQGMDQTRKELENLNLVSEELKTIV